MTIQTLNGMPIGGTSGDTEFTLKGHKLRYKADPEHKHLVNIYDDKWNWKFRATWERLKEAKS